METIFACFWKGNDYLTLLALGCVMLLHLCDIVLTYLALSKVGRDYVNPEVMELNFHRWFFERFGLLKGVCMSACISMSIMVYLAYSSLKTFPAFYPFMLGLLFLVVYRNLGIYLRIEKDALIPNRERLRYLHERLDEWEQKRRMS